MTAVQVQPLPHRLVLYIPRMARQLPTVIRLVNSHLDCPCVVPPPPIQDLELYINLSRSCRTGPYHHVFFYTGDFRF